MIVRIKLTARCFSSSRFAISSPVGSRHFPSVDPHFAHRILRGTFGAPQIMHTLKTLNLRPLLITYFLNRNALKPAFVGRAVSFETDRIQLTRQPSMIMLINSIIHSPSAP